MNKNVGVLGCGWLGFPLAKELLNKGYNVRGTTTSDDKTAEIQKAGIIPYKVILGEYKINGDIEGFLKGINTLIVNVPPKLRGGGNENYVQKMKLLHSAIGNSGIKHIVFISSTSVYGDVTGVVTEDAEPNPVTESGKQVLASENIFREDGELKATVIRFGGLIGPKRHPITHLSGKKGLKNGHEHVNLIHLEDCIHLISKIVENDHWNLVFNGVYPYHPLKREYYPLIARKKGLPEPQYDESEGQKSSKIVKSKLIPTKNISFLTSII